YIHRQFSAESEIIYSEIIAPVEPVKSETQPLPEAVTTSEPEPTMATATKPKPKRKSETQSLQEPIVICDTDYLANGNTPDPDSDLMPDEWIESLLASELTNRYISMISMLETEEEEETSNTPEL
ncbi:MAG: hypothetical protein K2M05_02620, partial [Paramuribaculum sp.]|nr:hypothetical protein [Paramuribaculum sp.]